MAKGSEQRCLCFTEVIDRYDAVMATKPEHQGVTERYVMLVTGSSQKNSPVYGCETDRKCRHNKNHTKPNRFLKAFTGFARLAADREKLRVLDTVVTQHTETSPDCDALTANER